jgi:hypothetical protein
MMRLRMQDLKELLLQIIVFEFIQFFGLNLVPPFFVAERSDYKGMTGLSGFT